MILTALLIALLTFIIVYANTHWWIKYFLRRIHLEVKDQNKEGTPLVTLSGGIPILSGMVAGILLFIFIRTFSPVDSGLILDQKNLSYLFAAMMSITIITIVVVSIFLYLLTFVY